MIFEPLSLADRHGRTHPLFPAAFQFLRTLPSDLSDGRCEIDGDRLFAMVQSYTTTPAAERKFEHHRKYADIQFVVAGEEVIAHSPLAGMEVELPYQAEKDYGLVKDPAASSSVVIRPGQFGIYFPEDAHKPGCSLTGPVAMRKIVVKVLL